MIVLPDTCIELLNRIREGADEQITPASYVMSANGVSRISIIRAKKRIPEITMEVIEELNILNNGVHQIGESFLDNSKEYEFRCCLIEKLIHSIEYYSRMLNLPREYVYQIDDILIKYLIGCLVNIGNPFDPDGDVYDYNTVFVEVVDLGEGNPIE